MRTSNKLLASTLLATSLIGQEADSDLSPYFSYIGEAWNIADGGSQTGGRSLGLASAGFDWTPSLLGGGTLHVNFQSMHGRDPSGFAGDANALSNIAFDEGTRLFQAWYGRETSWGELKTGLLALDDDFMGSDYAGLFINAAFGPMPVESFNVGAPIWPIGGLGVWTLFELSEDSGLQIAAYDGDAGDFDSNDDGFNNRINGKDGAMLMAEYHTTTSTFGGTTTLKVGGFHNTGEAFTNYRTNASEKGLAAIYAVIDHAVSEDLGLWTRFGTSLDDDISTVTAYIEGGLVTQSPLAGRPDDLLGIGYFWTEFGDAYLGANSGVSSTESTLEITYNAPLTENIYIQPDAQWIFDAHDSNSDVFVVGIRAGIDF